MDESMAAPLDPERHEVFVRRRRGCPACMCPTAILVALVDRASGRAFLMCDEVEEGFWSGGAATESLFDPNRDLTDWRPAEHADLVAAGWDPTDFERFLQRA